MRAVVMAGGEGSRLRPLTSGRPKPLVPVANRPIMEHIVRHLARHGVDEVVATVYYLADEIEGDVRRRRGVGRTDPLLPRERAARDGGAVKNAEGMLRDGGTFLIVSGDALTDLDVGRALAFHREKGALATLVLYRVPNPLEFGVVVTDDEGRVQRFLEKPTWSEVFSDTVNTGMYILEPEVLDLMEPGRAYDWSSDIFPRLLEEGKPMFGYVMDDYWADVGSLGPVPRGAGGPAERAARPSDPRRGADGGRLHGLEHDGRSHRRPRAARLPGPQRAGEGPRSPRTVHRGGRQRLGRGGREPRPGRWCGTARTSATTPRSTRPSSARARCSSATW